MLRLDGSYGEGGGQMLRTSLSLSARLGAPLRLEQIRAGRAQPATHFLAHPRQNRAAPRVAPIIYRGLGGEFEGRAGDR